MLDLSTLSCRQRLLKLCFLYRLIHGLIFFPTSDNYFMLRPTSGPATRSNSPTLCIPFARTSFFCNASRLWNDLPAEIVSLPSLASFKHAFWNYLGFLCLFSFLLFLFFPFSLFLTLSLSLCISLPLLSLSLSLYLSLSSPPLSLSLSFWYITQSCIPLYTVYLQHNYNISHAQWWNAGMGNTDTLHPILVSVIFPSLHLKYFRIKFLLYFFFMRMCTKSHPHPVIS